MINGFGYKNIGEVKNSQEYIFIGLGIDFHLGIGFHINIGFNVPKNIDRRIKMLIKIRRLAASYIDFHVCFFLIYGPLYLLESVTQYIPIVLIFTILSLAIFCTLLIYKDLLFKNASIGKKIMRLKIYHNGVLPSKKALIDRNIQTLSVFPGYPFMILINNKSQGDLMNGTEVK